MRVAELADSWGLDNLHVVERPTPEPAHGEVRLKMRAASINFRDWLTVQGKYNPRQPLPLIPCSDGAGEVDAVGEGVTKWKVGDRVMPAFFTHWVAGQATVERLRSSLGGPRDGTLAEFMVLGQEALAAIPDHLSFAQAAALPCAAVTAWNALVEQGGVRAGDVVLVQGTGGVSMFALQFALMHGARVIATSSSDEKLESLRDEYGVTDVINYRTTPEWGRLARQMSGGLGVDHVVEVGGTDTLPQSIRAVRPGGVISLIGVLSGGAEAPNLIPVLMRNIRVQGVIVGPREVFERMNRAISQTGLVPHLDRHFSLAESRQAFEWLAAGKHQGKVVVEISAPAA